MPCTSKHIFATFTSSANADKIQKYKIEWFSETENLLLLNLWQRPKDILIDILHFDIPTH